MLAVDFRGHGRSDAVEDFSIDLSVDDVAAVVAALELGEPLVVGHSLGGMVAVSYGAAAQPARAIINVDGHGSGHPTQFEGVDPAVIEAALDRWAELSVASFSETIDCGDKAWMEAEIAETMTEIATLGPDPAAIEPLVRRAYRDLGDGRSQRSPSNAMNIAMYRSLRGLDMVPRYLRCARGRRW